MTRVCLINPPSPFLMDDKVFPALGILKVAAAIEEDYDVVVSDGGDIPDADLYGITATTPQFPDAVKIASSLKKPIVLGGPHGTLSYAAFKRSERAYNAVEQITEHFDAVVLGDGEKAAHRAFMDPHGIYNGDSKSTGYFMSGDYYNQTGRPARHLIDLSQYHYEIDGHSSTSLIGQLGCPFMCGFCGGRHSPSLRHIRTRSPESIVDEIEFLHTQYGYTGFMFFDDELNVNPKFSGLLVRLVDLQERLGVDFRFRGFVKAELFTKDQAVAMHRAGFRWMLSGFEAANNKTLRNMQKRATLGDNTKAVEIAKAAGMKVKALMSIGHPGETENSVSAIGEWLSMVDVDDFDLTIITPYPGSPYYDKSVRYEENWVYKINGDNLYSRDVDYAKDADFYKGAPGEYKSYVWTDALSSGDIVKLRDSIDISTRWRLGIKPISVTHETSMGQQ